MSPRRRSILALAIALPVVGALSWFLLVRQDGFAPAATSDASWGLRWRQGQTQHYTFRVDTTVWVQADERVDHSQPIAQQLRGVLELQTLAVDPDGATVGMRLDPVELRLGGATDAATNRMLGAPFRVRFEDSGLPTAFAFPAAVVGEQRELLEELVRTFQFVVRSEATWVAEETHRTGVYTARYERDGRDLVRRTKLHYAEPAGASAPHVQVRASQATVRLDPAVDWITGMELQETLVASDTAGLGFEVETKASLQLVPAAARPVAQPSSAWDLAVADPAVAVTTAPSRVSPLAAVPTDQLGRQLAEIVASLDASQQGRIDWVHRLRDFLQADPRVAALLLGILQQQELGDRTRAELLFVFELGATVEAQAALCRVVADPEWTRRDRTRALIALGGIETPTDASLTTLWAAARDRSSAAAKDQANTALLALGASASRMVGEHAAGYANLRDGLLSTAWGAQDPGERAIAVMALGNTGDAGLGAEVVPFLDDAAPEVRRAAAKTFGKLRQEDASIELGLRLEHEQSSAVRAAMAAAMVPCKSPPPAAMELVRTAIGRERDEVTRLELARFLGRNLAADPENGRVLRSLLESEQSKKVRRYLGQVLGNAELAAEQARNGTGGVEGR